MGSPNTKSQSVSAGTLVKSFVYKETPQARLEIFVHYPRDWKEKDRRPAIVFFFGGGFKTSNITQFAPQADFLAARGMVAARADYRVKVTHGVTPREGVEDGRSAIRWLRRNAGKLGIDSTRIVASGGSSGGNIAACATLAPGFGANKPGPGQCELDAVGEDASVSCQGNLMVLFNPVLQLTDEERLLKLHNLTSNGDPGLTLSSRPDIAADLLPFACQISPTLQLTKSSPATLLIFGTADDLYPQGPEYMARAQKLGVHAEFFTAEGQPHGFFNRSPWLERTNQRMAEFLQAMGYLKAV